MDPFTDLPEEKIEEICLKLDDTSLAKFMQTSNINRRICGSILQKRKENYERIRNDIIETLENTPDSSYNVKQIWLESTDNNREFVFARIYGIYEIAEIYHTPVLVLQKIGATSKPITFKIERPSGVLMKLLRGGYITGRTFSESQMGTKFTAIGF